MVERYFKGILISAFSLLFLSAPVFAEDRNYDLPRLARIEVQTPPAERDRAFDEEPTLPLWLERLLTTGPRFAAPEDEETSRDHETAGLEQASNDGVDDGDMGAPSFRRPRSIPPLYSSPRLEGEGVWSGDDAPLDPEGLPLVYKTVYRPSVDFPNSVVYLALFNMKRMKIRLFIGNTEPGISNISEPRNERLSRIVAITNAMWMQQHARGAGAIFRGQPVYPMVTGMATLVVYNDESVDVLEWTKDIPTRMVKDARQLRHLIVKNGNVVEKVAKRGKIRDAEIGLGGFLVDNRGSSTMRKKHWFLANRTGFGIREDGNLVFAMGHHVGTRDLAKALVLAGCKRAIHGDANIHNIVCNFYFRDDRNKVVKRHKLSPDQLKYTLKRYDRGYSKDFFAFYEK